MIESLGIERIRSAASKRSLNLYGFRRCHLWSAQAGLRPDPTLFPDAQSVIVLILSISAVTSRQRPCIKPCSSHLIANAKPTPSGATWG